MSEQQHPLLISTGDAIIPLMAHDPSSPLGLRFATEEEIAEFQRDNPTPPSDVECPEGFRPASPKAIANKRREVMVELLSQDELLDKIESDREARAKALQDEAIALRKAEISRCTQIQREKLESELRCMNEERRTLEEASALTARAKAQRALTAKKAEQRRALVEARKGEIVQEIERKVMKSAEAGLTTNAATRAAARPSTMGKVLLLPLLPFIWLIMLAEIMIRGLAASYAYASGDTARRRLILKTQNALAEAQNKEAERVRDAASSTKAVAGPRIERDPRIVDLIERAERLLVKNPELADDGNARIDDLVRKHLPRLEQHRHNVLEIGSPSAIIDANAMVEKALATAEISLAQATAIAAKVHLDGMDTEIRFLEMRTPDDGSNPAIAPLPKPAAKEITSTEANKDAGTSVRDIRRAEASRMDLKTESYAGRMITFSDYDTYGPSSYDGGGSSSGDW